MADLGGCAAASVRRLIAAGRSRELAIRAAIGASARRIVRQLLTESLVLSTVGGAAGILLAVWGTSLIVPLLPGEVRYAPMRPADEIGVDWVVLSFAVAISIVSGLLLGLAPVVATLRSDASRSRTARGDPRAAGARGYGTRWSRRKSPSRWSCSRARG